MINAEKKKSSLQKLEETIKLRYCLYLKWELKVHLIYILCNEETITYNMMNENLFIKVDLINHDLIN